MTASRRLAYAAALIFALAGVGGCKSGRIGNSVSPSKERDLGAKYASEIDGEVKLSMDGKLNRRLLAIAEPIFDQAMKDRPDVGYRLRIIDEPDVNAFSLPGGYVYIYRGLIDKLGSDDDALACVIGHESAHVVRRHVVRQMSDSQGKGILVGLAAILTRSNTIGQAGSALAALDQLHFSRTDEFEADRFGLKYAYNAGYDPAGMVRTFQLFQAEEKKRGGRPPAYALDHPINENRTLRALEEWRELRANGGQYLYENYTPDADKEAAKKSGIEYQALVLATMPQTQIPMTESKPAERKKAEDKP